MNDEQILKALPGSIGYRPADTSEKGAGNGEGSHGLTTAAVRIWRACETAHGIGAARGSGGRRVVPLNQNIDSRLPLAPQWFDIGSAPRDGTRIILRCKTLPHPFVGYWGDGKCTPASGAGEVYFDPELAGWNGAAEHLYFCDSGDVENNFYEEDIIGWAPLPSRIASE
jgi:hypothetical protein